MQNRYLFKTIESLQSFGQEPAASPVDTLGDNLGGFFDRDWYVRRYPDVGAAKLDPLQHYLNYGAAENRDPNPFFDAAWYLQQNPDVARAKINPLLHYLQHGGAELRNPHPRFDAAFYVSEHPEATLNPLLFHLRVGVSRGWPTENVIEIDKYLPSGAGPFRNQDGVAVDIVIPVYRGLDQTRRCIESLRRDPDRPPGRIIVIDDCSPEPKLSAWLDRQAGRGTITLLRNPRNLGFVASVNQGIRAAGERDIVLLNSDTEVPHGWLQRLAAQAYAAPRIGSVSPFSNNATICSYPSVDGAPLAFELPLADLDSACRKANAGRFVVVPTTVGFCMYIRRACIDETGLFDEQAFRRGYGEENDFCMRAAARGWTHRLACDTFVYHEGGVSFGKDSPELKRSRGVLLRRHPDYERAVARHVRLDAAGPFRFAITAELFRKSGRPTVLLVSHALGGGVPRHLDDLRRAAGASANFLLLKGTPRGIALSVPALPGHPVLSLGEDRLEDLALFLRSAGVTRLHLHHMLGMRLDVRQLIHMLDVPFDFTVHDYFTICPRVNLLPTMDSQHCGEPAPALCNDCIAQSPANGARDIQDWRHAHRWIFLEADRVICPSEDVRNRLARYGLDRKAVVVPHEPVARAPWPLHVPAPRGRKLRVAVLGVLADQKGAPTVAAVAEAADPGRIEIHLIGYPELELPEPARARIKRTGRYEEAELPALLARLRPHVVWFPAQWPETYSYTLSAAIEAGLPIVASDIGAFTERLAGRPLTWLVDPAAPPATWIDVFESVRSAVQAEIPKPKLRRPQGDFYAAPYLRAVTQQSADKRARAPSTPGRRSIVLIPERLDTGCLSPCAYIRLLSPLDHPAIGGDAEVIVADAEQALCYRPDVIVTHRHGVRDLDLADALATHCSTNGIALLYDLDDDLLDLPPEHPDTEILAARAAVVARMVRAASSVWVSTPVLRKRVLRLRKDAVVVPNGLDERLWPERPPPSGPRAGPVRILFMGTATHDADLALIEPALRRVRAEFGNRVSIDIIGVTTRSDLPAGIKRLDIPSPAAASYPAFVNWLTRQPGWDIGLAPLTDTPFNGAKSSIKALDYAALGMLTLASDMSVYRGSLADGPGGLLLPNIADAWYAAISRLIRNPLLRHRLSNGAHEAYARQHTLAAQAALRRELWHQLAPTPAVPLVKRARC